MSARAWGAKIFRDQGCVGCHDLGGADGAGGSLVGLYGKDRKLSSGQVVIADEDYLRASILSPNSQVVAGRPAVMPSYRDKLGPAELDALVSFLTQLR
jgi:cytochrome c oxidase subunit II